MGDDCEGVGKYGSNGMGPWDYVFGGCSVIDIVRHDSWVVTGAMLKFLERFHHRATRQITGMTEKRGVGG